MHRVFRLVLPVIFVPFASVEAQQFESQTLFEKGAWEVELTHDLSDGDLWCDANTENRRGQQLSLVGYSKGALSLFVIDSSWQLRERPVNFILQIDRERWTVEGGARNNSISVNITDEDQAAEFLKDLKNGSAVALYNESETKIGDFSLNGSGASMGAFVECWGAIQSNNNSSDPFETQSDPF